MVREDGDVLATSSVSPPAIRKIFVARDDAAETLGVKLCTGAGANARKSIGVRVKSLREEGPFWRAGAIEEGGAP